MASETNELTFVRCTTCRSLVPASAARCRICNAALAAESSNDSHENSEKPSRERHRKVSARPDEVEKMTSGIANQRDERSASDTMGAHGGDDAFDPLGAFLEELDAEEPASNQADEVDSPFDDTSDGDVDFDEIISELDDDLDLEPIATDSTPSMNANPDFERDFNANDSASAGISEKPPRPSHQREAKPISAPHKGEKQPQRSPGGEQKRFDREQQKLAPRGAKPRFGGKAKREEHASQSAVQNPLKKEKAKSNTHVGAERGVPSSPSSAMQQGNARRLDDRSRGNQSAERVESPRSLSSSVKSDVGVKSSATPNQHAHKEHISESQGRSKIRTGRLFGWLISYENRDGRAIELRSGRFFITGTSIRDSDLILEDQSMSTPHALVSITERGLLIQDLMSERGTFVRSEGDAQYRREEAVIEVKHGDWIRFGDVEFLVALVPE